MQWAKRQPGTPTSLIQVPGLSPGYSTLLDPASCKRTWETVDDGWRTCVCQHCEVLDGLLAAAFSLAQSQLLQPFRE